MGNLRVTPYNRRFNPTRRGRRARNSILILSVISLSAVSFYVSGDIAVKRYRGIYTTGFEVDIFRPCGSQGRWWVAADSSEKFEKAFSSFEVPHDFFETRSLYVEWEGKKSRLGSFGHLGGSQREIRITDIVKVKKYEGDCDQ